MATPFPDDVVQLAWQRAGAECECMDMARCLHPLVPHGRQLKWDDRGKDGSVHGWETHHIDPNGELTATNCRILCIECHMKTATYGRSG